MNISGIYAIICRNSGRYYVGSSNCIRRRKSKHFSDLIKNRHHNHYLQNIFNKYGKDSIFFIICEECPPQDLIKIEQRYLDEGKFDSFCVNYSFSADRTSITEETRKKISLSLKGRIFSKQHKTQISLSKKGKKRINFSNIHIQNLSKSATGKNNSFYGKRHTNESKRKMSNSRNGKIPFWLMKKIKQIDLDCRRSFGR